LLQDANGRFNHSRELNTELDATVYDPFEISSCVYALGNFSMYAAVIHFVFICGARQQQATTRVVRHGRLCLYGPAKLRRALLGDGGIMAAFDLYNVFLFFFGFSFNSLKYNIYERTACTNRNYGRASPPAKAARYPQVKRLH
jgi:hypothetical protein